uniref:(northern house mosquito) hypothetical protein n=1 Tax=Culex pipiens TaxID=7175 RepID=A0A8D8KYG7_CULPI
MQIPLACLQQIQDSGSPSFSQVFSRQLWNHRGGPEMPHKELSIASPFESFPLGTVQFRSATTTGTVFSSSSFEATGRMSRPTEGGTGRRILCRLVAPWPQILT